MVLKTKGKCKYCGKEYTKAYMGRHLSACKERKKVLEGETGRTCGYFLLSVCGKYDSGYWLFAEMRDTATLEDLDSFLRDIWLECCGHLSAFYIDGVSYELFPDEDDYWDVPVKSMKCKLKSVLKKGMSFSYEYDFGSTTELIITVLGERKGHMNKEKLTLLSRNNPPVYTCDACGKKPAVAVCSNCFWSGEGWLCEDCAKTHECGEEMLLKACNSPRVGVCAYDGSDIYPDQFVPDQDLS